MASKRKVDTTVTRKARPLDRIPVGGRRDKLTVQGLDPAYSYRWVLDKDENGQRIFEFIEGGWDFVSADGLRVGQNYVYNSENVGSIVRRPGGNGEWLYLMRIPKEYYEADQKVKEMDLKETEKQMARERNIEDDDGQYGGGKVTSSFKF